MKDAWRCWVPVLNVKDARASADFYCRVLGFQQDWEHQFGEGFPLYLSLSRDNLTLHLNEHGNDDAPTTLIISVEDVDAAYADIRKQGFEPPAPPQDQPYGVRDFSLCDPDGHQLIIAAPLSDFENASGRTMSQSDD